MFFKLSFVEFKELDAPDLIINIWLYNDPKNTGYFCLVIQFGVKLHLKKNGKKNGEILILLSKKLEKMIKILLMLENIRLRTDI